MDRILADAPTTLEVVFYTPGTSAAVDAGAVTIQVLRDDGTELVAAGTAATKDTGATGRYTYDLTAANTAQLDQLTAIWTSTSHGDRRTYHEIVGGFYFELAELKATRNLSGKTDAELASMRAEVEDRIEKACDVAFVRRFAREDLWGDGLDHVILQWGQVRELLAVDADGTAETTSDWTVDAAGIITITRGSGDGVFKSATRYGVRYVHGYDAPPPALKEAALDAARYLLLEDVTNPSARATSFDNEFGSYRINQAGDDRPFGFPDVDARVMKHAEPRPVMA